MVDRFEALAESLELDDPLSRELLESEAASFLETVASEHGWKNMFYYGIPLPADFHRIFLFQVEHMSLTRALALYECICAEYQAAVDTYGNDIFEYNFPHPREWAHWNDEVQNCPINKLFQIFDIEKIAHYELMSGEEIILLRSLKGDYERYERRWEEEGGEIEAAYQRELAPFLQVKEERINAAKQTFLAHAAHRELRQLVTKQVKERSFLRTNLNRILQPYEEQLSQAQNAPGPYWAGKAEDITREMDKLRHEHDQADQTIRERYDAFRHQFIAELQAAKESLDRETALANRQYRRDTATLTLRRNDQLRAPLRTYNEAMDVLDHRYDVAFRNDRILLDSDSCQ